MHTKEQTLNAIDSLILDCEKLHAAFLQNFQMWTPDFIAWQQASKSTIEAIFGTYSDALRSFSNIYFTPPRTQATGHENQVENRTWYSSGLRYSHEVLRGLRYSVELLAPDEQPNSLSPYIFISHGGKTRTHVDATKQLIENLGLFPIVVADLPNFGVSINDKVLGYMALCHAAIVLATVEDEVIAGEQRTRPNVENEIGLLQASTNIGNRIIYLKEQDVKFASNYREKVWYLFERENMEKSFLGIIKELRAFRLLP